VSDRAVEIWGMNYPGFGGSTGPAWLSKIGPAALAAFDECESRSRPANRAFGTSMAQPSALMSRRSRPAGLADDSADSSPLPRNDPCVDLAGGICGCWRALLRYRFRKTSTALKMGKRSCTGDFLLAEKDEVVPARYHRLVVDAYAGESA